MIRRILRVISQQNNLRQIRDRLTLTILVATGGTSALAQPPSFDFTDVATSPPLSNYRAGTGDMHGPGGVFTDLDADGFPELVLVRGPSTPASPQPVSVFHNLPGATAGQRTFQEIQLTSPGNVAGATGVVAGDYDNDGDLDLYVLRHSFNPPSGVAADELWESQLIETGDLSFVRLADTATDPTPAADRQLGLSNGSWQGSILELSLTAAWADVDRDGDLDLYVGKHDTAVILGDPLIDPAGERDILYLNNGDGTFTDYTLEADATGYETPTGDECAGAAGRLQCYAASNAVIFADLDNDRWPDLVVTNKMNNPGIGADMLYRNLGADANGRWRGFDNIAYQMTDFGHSADPALGTHNAMGIDVGDFDNDGDLDLYVTDADCARYVGGELETGCDVGPRNDLFSNQLIQKGKLDFTDLSNGAVGDVRADFSWGTQWLDADNDGDLDLHVATAGVLAFPGGDIADFFYLNEGGVFVDRASDLQVDQIRNVRGDMAADYNRDGAIDFFAVNVDDGNGNPTPSRLYRSNLTAGTGGKNFLSLRLLSHPTLPPAPFKSTRDAIGARVTVTASGLPNQIREVVAGNGNAASTASHDLEFGLGSATQATVQVDWPSGRTSNHTVASNQFLTLSEQGFSNGQVIGESGQININHNSTTVVLSRSYQKPVVFAQPASFNGGDVSIVRVTNVQSDRFSVFVQEAPNHDGPHATETVHWVVLEGGSWRLADGTRLEVGSMSTSSTVNRGQWSTVNLGTPLGNGNLMPVVLSQVQTTNDTSAWVKTRQRNADADSFQVGLEAEEAFTGFLSAESIGWLAMEPARGLWNGRFYAAGTSRDAVNENFLQLDFGQELGTSPHFVASLATYDGADPSGIRYRNLTAGGVEVKVEEDTTLDGEINHATERVSFLALAGSGDLTANALVADTGPTANFTDSCSTLRCTFTSTSTDNQSLPGYGFAWVFGDGNAGNGDVATHTYDLPGTYSVRLTVTDNAGQTSTKFRTVNVTGPTIRLAASYVPSLGQSPVTSRSSNDDPAFFDFFFDPNLGKFEERPGAACNKGRPENPTYLKIFLETTQAMSSCTFQGSWDPAPIICDVGEIAALNSGTPIILDTDDIEMDGSTCEDTWPPVPRVLFNEVHWFRVTMNVGGVTHERRVRFRQRAETVHLFEDPTIAGDEFHDTYVDSSFPFSTFGNNTLIRVQRGVPTRFGFLNVDVPPVPMLPVGASYASAQLQLKVATGTSSSLHLHHLSGTGNWTENQLTWGNWGPLTGGSGGVFQTLPAFTTGEHRRIDVTSDTSPGQAFDIGLENATPTSGDLLFRSSEWSIVSQRPKLVVTFQR